MTDVPGVDAPEARARLERGAVLVDVRQPWEWEELRIPGAVLVPLDDLPDRLDEIPSDVEVVVHCRSGQRSARAVTWLRSRGRHRAVNLAGGIEAWAACGFPVEGTASR